MLRPIGTNQVPEEQVKISSMPIQNSVGTILENPVSRSMQHTIDQFPGISDRLKKGFVVHEDHVDALGVALLLEDSSISQIDYTKFLSYNILSQDQSESIITALENDIEPEKVSDFFVEALNFRRDVIVSCNSWDDDKEFIGKYWLKQEPLHITFSNGDVCLSPALALTLGRERSFCSQRQIVSAALVREVRGIEVFRNCTNLLNIPGYGIM